MFCASPLDLQDEQFNDHSLNEDTFINGVSVLCEALNVKANLGVIDTKWRLLGVDNFVDCICCGKCYQLISELVSLHKLIVESQISLKENARELENIVASSEDPSLEYSVNACVLLRQEILTNHAKQSQPAPRPRPQPKHELSRKSKSVRCPKQAVILLERLEINPPPLIKQDIDFPPIKASGDDNDVEFMCPSPSSVPEAKDPDDEDAKDEEDDDQEYQPIKRKRRSMGRKRGRPKKIKPPKVPRKPGRPRKITQSSPVPSSAVTRKRKRNKKPASYLFEEESQTEMDVSSEKPTIPSKKGGKPIIIGSRHYRFLHEGSGPILHAIYLLSKSPSPQGEEMETYLMMYNVKFCKTSTSLRCLHPQCDHQETLTGYFTDQTILRNMRFHIRFAHRSPPKKDKPEQDKPSSYYCHSCESQLDNKLDLLEHRRQLHSEEDDQLPCFCEVCGDPSVPPGDLIQHVFSHKSDHEKDLILEESKKRGIGKDKDVLKPMIHPCDQCDKTFKWHTELMGHRVRHLPPELKVKVVCEICGRGSRTAFALELHKRRVHYRDLPVEHECHVCGKGFLKGQKERWKEHLNMHTGEKPYQCQQCGKGFTAKKYLINHVDLMHKGGKDKVTCEFCGLVYKAEKYLRKHTLAKHRDKVKLKRCQYWAEEGEDMNKYRPLEQRSDFIGPRLMFPCEPCGKAFIFKSMLITHLKNRHKMFYERKEEYPWQLTLEDVSKIGAGTST